MAAYVPTDCPTREKHGWLGDAQVTAEQAFYNLWTPTVYRIFLDEIRDQQMGPKDGYPHPHPPSCIHSLILALAPTPSYGSQVRRLRAARGAVDHHRFRASQEVPRAGRPLMDGGIPSE